MRSLIKDEANISCQMEFMHVSADAHYGNSIECKFKLPGTQTHTHTNANAHKGIEAMCGDTKQVLCIAIAAQKYAALDAY